MNRLLCFVLEVALVVPVAAAAQSPAASNLATLVTFDQYTGSVPQAGLAADAQGHLFGSTTFGGSGACYGGSGCGTLFVLLPPTTSDGWLFRKLHDFQDTTDGTGPQTPLTVAPDGTIYGTNFASGAFILYALTPVENANGAPGWRFRVVFRFVPSDPTFTYTDSPLVWHAGALYGVANGGSTNCPVPGCGYLFRLDPPSAGQGWTFSIVYAFDGTEGLGQPTWVAGGAGQGPLYVTTGFQNGAAVEFDQDQHGSWSPHVIATFFPFAQPTNLLLAIDGSLFGLSYAARGGSLVFHLVPPTSGHEWTHTNIATVKVRNNPVTSLNLAPNGSLIGVIQGDFDFYAGNAFMLTPAANGAPWTYEQLWNFNDGPDRNPVNIVSGYDNKLYVVLDGGDSDGGSVVELLTRDP